MTSCHCRLTSLRSTEVATSCASYSRLSGHCLKMRVKHWSRHSSPVAWTTATLFFGISEGLMNRLQLVQNAAALLVTGTRRSDNITPLLRQLHWFTGRPTPAHRLQGCDARSSVTVWYFTIVHSQWPPSFCRCSRATNIPSTTCRTCVESCDVGTFDDRICSCSTWTMELSSIARERGRLVVQ